MDAEQVTPEANFVDDLGADSLDTGYIHKIIDKIPATNEVKDVSIFKRVTLLERIKKFFVFK